MKHILVIATLLAATAVQAADTGACYNITDSDARGYCIAKARRDVSQCYNIVRSDMRALCLAEVSK